MKMHCAYPYTARTNAAGQTEIGFVDLQESTVTLESKGDSESIHKAAKQLLLDIFEARMAKHETIPGGQALASKGGDAFVFVNPLVLAKLVLYNEFCKAGASNNAFAKKVGVSPTSFGRLLNVRHESKERLIFSAFAALGIKTDWDFSLVPIERSYPT